jgi:hypothetical protein
MQTIKAPFRGIWVISKGRGRLHGCDLTDGRISAQVQLDVVSAIDGGAFDAVLREGDDSDAGSARGETIRLQGKLDALARRYAADEFSDGEWRAMRESLVEQLDAAERRYAEPTRAAFTALAAGAAANRVGVLRLWAAAERRC